MPSLVSRVKTASFFIPISNLSTRPVFLATGIQIPVQLNAFVMEDFVQSVPVWADGVDSVLLTGIRDLLRSLANSTSIPGLAEQIDLMIEPIEDRLHSDLRNDLVYQQFGHLLEQFASLETIDQQVALLRNTPYDLSCLEQLEALINQFRPASQAEAGMVAMAIKFRC